MLLRWLAAIIGLAYLGLRAWRMLGEAKWPVTEGTIDGAEPRELQDTQGMTRTVLEVSYSFRVDDTFYGGEKEFGFRAGRPYRQLLGRKVRVRYKPDQPDTSELLSDPFETSSSAPELGNDTERPIKIFRCPSCQQYINDSMTKCRYCGTAIDMTAVAINRISSLPYVRLMLLSIVFWAVAVFMFKYRNWIPAGLFAIWPFTPIFLFPFMMLPWLMVRRFEIGYPNVNMARRVAGALLWAWALSFVIAPMVLFVARPDLLGQVSKIMWWGFTHYVHPYPY